MELYEGNISLYYSLYTCAFFVKREILTLNPPVSPQGGGCVVWVCVFARAHTCIGIDLYVLADIRVAASVKLTSATEGSVWIICPQRDALATHMSANVS